MFSSFFININKYLETLLERISIRKLLITLLLIFVGLAIGVFAIFTYEAIYKSIFNERVAKIKYIDDFAVEILEYQNLLVLKKQKTLKQAQEDSIGMLKRVHFENDDYIWIDRYDSSMVYHPRPATTSNEIVNAQIRKMVKESGEGYLQYKWEKFDANKVRQFTKVTYVEGYKPWGWIVGTGVYIDDINHKVIKSILEGVLPVLLILILLGIILKFIFFKAFLNPIDRLADLSLRLASNDLNVTLPVAKSDTEVGKLYRIFNKFVELFEKEKKTAERERVLRDIIDKMRSSLDLEDTLSFICEETTKLFGVQRSAIGTFARPGDGQNFIIRKEYRLSPELEGFTKGFHSSETADYWKKNLLKNGQVLAFDNIDASDAPQFFKDTYEDLGVKSVIGTSIRKGQDVWGTLVLSEYNNYREWSEEEKTLLKTIADQVYIAVNQAELFERERKTAERERVLRDIIEKIRSSLDYEDTLDYICKETATLFNVQRSTIVSLPPNEDLSTFVVNKEYKTDPKIEGLSHVVDFSKISQFWWTSLIHKKTVAIDNVGESNLPEDFKEAYLSIGVKSIISIAINNNENLWGSLVLSEYNEFRHWNEEEKTLLLTIADQIYLAIHQAELFRKEKESAETERFNRKILEILRNSLDKETIKHLFVKNIGQYFHADRVFFSDYDPVRDIFLPIDKTSEYLSSSNEKSFVGWDWSDVSWSEYIRPLLEKRELKIFCWKDYIKDNPKSQGFISRFEDSNVKSSYNLPVIYEGRIIGYFCIEFTQKDCVELSDEEINRIRSMCTQAGIALYHAELFVKAQEAVNFKDLFINKIKSGTKEMLNDIVGLFDAMSKTEAKCDEHLKHLERVNEIVKNLLDFTNNIESGK